jgi:hypothetical protein
MLTQDNLRLKLLAKLETVGIYLWAQLFIMIYMPTATRMISGCFNKIQYCLEAITIIASMRVQRFVKDVSRML